LRKLILGAALAALAAPTLAQPPRHYDPRRDEIVRVLPSPREVDRMGDAVARVADALMSVDVGPVADAVDPYRPHRVRTLGDLASRRDPYARERMHDEIADATAGLGAATREVAILTPVLRDTLLDATLRMEAAIRESRLRREREYDRRDRDEDRYNPR
jgi:hypothetical protein